MLLVFSLAQDQRRKPSKRCLEEAEAGASQVFWHGAVPTHLTAEPMRSLSWCLDAVSGRCQCSRVHVTVVTKHLGHSNITNTSKGLFFSFVLDRVL